MRMARHHRQMHFLILVIVGLLQLKDVLAEQTIGWVNSAKIYPEKITVHARMDTGAKTTSLRGASIRTFTRHGKQWISIDITDKKGHIYTLEQPITKFIKIKQHAGMSKRRPIIQLGICVGDIYKEVEVSITEKAGFNYPLLIGRNFLAGSFFIDSSKTYTIKPVCTRPVK